MKFRKKPIVIEAEQYLGPATIHPRNNDTPLPSGVEWRSCGQSEMAPRIETLEGELNVSPGDWIITGVNGERYPCKPDIFQKIYEAVE